LSAGSDSPFVPIFPEAAYGTMNPLAGLPCCPR
jgi:hypothetical protein